MKKTIYVDMDGTLLDNSLDAQFIASGYDKAWYNEQYVTTLAVNYKLVRVLKKLAVRGNTLILWTNRGEEQREMTKENLGDLWTMFTDHRFYCGKKLGTNVDGYTIDNEAKYVTNGIHLTW